MKKMIGNQMNLIILLLLTINLITGTFGVHCTNPKVSVTSFSTQDATILTHIAHISEFTLTCSNNVNIVAIFAEFPCGKIIPAAKVAEHKYQVNWLDDIKRNSNENIVLRLYDEEGYANIRKAQRDSDDHYNKNHNVKPLIDITVTTKKAYKGPWVKAELVAAIIMATVSYFAITIKHKIQS